MLGGYSFGGYVAYEMARQLQERKQRVDGLFLFDLPANTPQEVTSALDDADYLVGYFKNNLPLLAGNARIGRGIELLEIKKVSGATPAERFQSVVEQLIQLEILPEGTELSQVRNYVLGARLRERALCEYSLRPYPGSALLIRADDNPAIVERSPDPDDLTLGWGGLCTGRVKVEWVPGTHKTFLLPPHVEKVAEVLRSYLRTL
jgi:thioesterase domain-containing protein